MKLIPSQILIAVMQLWFCICIIHNERPIFITLKKEMILNESISVYILFKWTKTVIYYITVSLYKLV